VERKPEEEWPSLEFLVPLPLDSLILFLDGVGKGYNSEAECHLDVARLALNPMSVFVF
jgi:hypothetical protein